MQEKLTEAKRLIKEARESVPLTEVEHKFDIELIIEKLKDLAGFFKTYNKLYAKDVIDVLTKVTLEGRLKEFRDYVMQFK